MARVRVSTTVDESLLEEARRLRSESNDAALLDEALAALLARHRAAQIDAAYAASDAHPIDELDKWGGLAAFGEAAGRSCPTCPPGVGSGGVSSPKSPADLSLCCPGMSPFRDYDAR